MITVRLGVTDATTSGILPNKNKEFGSMSEKMNQLDKLVTHMTDMLGSLKGQSGTKTMVVEIGREIFKGESQNQALS
eukprot:4429078-Ditylum_brightwellii.AAC.1